MPDPSSYLLLFQTLVDILILFQCEAGLGTRVLVDQIYSEPQKLMLLGGGCSTATQAIAATAYHWNLVTASKISSPHCQKKMVLVTTFLSSLWNT